MKITMAPGSSGSSDRISAAIPWLARRDGRWFPLISFSGLPGIKDGLVLQHVDMNKHDLLLIRRQAVYFGDDLSGCHAMTLGQKK